MATVQEQFRDETGDSNDDLNSIFSGSSASGSGIEGSLAEKEALTSNIGLGETQLVKRSKWIVYLVIACSATVAGCLTFYFVKQSEKRWYEDEVRTVL